MKMLQVFLSFLFATAVSAADIGFVSGPRDDRPDDSQPNTALFLEGEFTESFFNELLGMNYWLTDKETAIMVSDSQHLPKCTISFEGTAVIGGCACTNDAGTFVIEQSEGSYEQKTIRKIEEMARKCHPLIKEESI